MLFLLMSKPNKSWTRDLLDFMRDCSSGQEIAYVIERCCERIAAERLAKTKRKRPSSDDGFPRRMYEAALRNRAGSSAPPLASNQKSARGVSSCRLQRSTTLLTLEQMIADLVQQLKDLPSLSSCTMTHPCCTWECRNCHHKLRKFITFSGFHMLKSELDRKYDKNDTDSYACVIIPLIKTPQLHKL